MPETSHGSPSGRRNASIWKSAAMQSMMRDSRPVPNVAVLILVVDQCQPGHIPARHAFRAGFPNSACRSVVPLGAQYLFTVMLVYRLLRVYINRPRYTL